MVAAAGVGSPLTLICTLTGAAAGGPVGASSTTPTTTRLFESKLAIRIPDDNTWLSSTIPVAGVKRAPLPQRSRSRSTSDTGTAVTW